MEADKKETETNMEHQGTDVKETKEIPGITTEELQAANNRLKKKANQQSAMESEPKKHAVTELQSSNNEK